MSARLRTQTGATGAVIFSADVQGTDNEGTPYTTAARILWLGSGSGLWLLFGDSMTRIEHPSADATYFDRRSAARAVAAFIAA